MTTFEEEFERFKPVLRRLSNFVLLGKKIQVTGEENFIQKGSNIIVGNHIGSFKDVATLCKIVPRPIFFTANKMIFSKEEFNKLISIHLRRHMKNLSLFIEVLLGPIKSLFIDYISMKIEKVGSIPVDMKYKKKIAVEKIHEYLRKGRAIIALQGDGRVQAEYPHPYVTPFKRGTSIIAYSLMKEGISVPITPLAFFGTHFPLMVPKKINVNVGRPMYISDYVREGRQDTIEAFRSALEEKVKELFHEIIRHPR